MNLRLHMLSVIHEWDVFTFRRIVSRPVTSRLAMAARCISHTGNGYYYPFTPLVILLLGLGQPLQFLMFALLAYGIERTLYVCAKRYFKRRRPANVLPDYTSVIIASDEFSFPSGHSSAAFLMVTLLVMTYGLSFAFLYAWAALIAVSRVLLGVHFPTDILVGSVMGCLLACMCSVLFGGVFFTQPL